MTMHVHRKIDDNFTKNLKATAKKRNEHYAWFNFICNHAPPGNPRDKSGPSGPGVGNCPKRSVSRGYGWGKLEIAQVKHVSCVSSMNSGGEEKDRDFIGKSVLMTLHRKYCVCVCEVVNISMLNEINGNGPCQTKKA